MNELNDLMQEIFDMRQRIRDLENRIRLYQAWDKYITAREKRLFEMLHGAKFSEDEG